MPSNCPVKRHIPDPDMLIPFSSPISITVNRCLPLDQRKSTTTNPLNSSNSFPSTCHKRCSVWFCLKRITISENMIHSHETGRCNCYCYSYIHWENVYSQLQTRTFLTWSRMDTPTYTNHTVIWHFNILLLIEPIVFQLLHFVTKLEINAVW